MMNKLTVKVYMMNNNVKSFHARDMDNAREIAKRIITEGMWTNKEEFYPVHQIYKVKIMERNNE